MEESEWDEVKNGRKDGLKSAIHSGSTSRRRQVLSQLHGGVAQSQLPQQLYGDLLVILFRTYPIYIDRASRRDVQRCVRALLESSVSSADIQKFSDILAQEASNSSIAPANAFVLVEWCALFLQFASRSLGNFSSLVLQTVSGLAKALETCLGRSTRTGLKQSAIVIGRRALRAILSSEPQGSGLVKDIVLRLTQEPAAGSKNVPMLGVLCGVCARLPGKKIAMDEMIPTVLHFYTKEVVSARSPAPAHIYNGMRDLFQSFATADSLRQYVWPSVEKSLLRNPEVLLDGALISLISSLPQDIGISEAFSETLCKPLLSNIKSTNAATRKGAVDTIKMFISRCSGEKWLSGVVGEVISPLKANKITNAEHRVLYAQILLAVPTVTSTSRLILDGLSQVLTRESTEAALEPEVEAFCCHLRFLFTSGAEIGKEHYAIVVKGCDDKRLGFRKLWLVNVGELFWSLDEASMLSSADFLKSLLEPVFSIFGKYFKEILANPLPSVQGGWVSVAYVLTALVFQKFQNASGLTFPGNEISQTVLFPTEKIPFLFNPRVYTKLSSKSDLQWVTRSLSTVSASSKFSTADVAVRDSWAQAFLYLICSLHLPSEIQRISISSLQQVYLGDANSVGPLIVQSIWKWLYCLDCADRESAAVSSGTANSRLSHVIRAISPSKSDLESTKNTIKDSLELQLIEMLVLCRNGLVKGTSWIDITLKTGTDPENLVSKYPSECLEQILLVTKDPIRSKVLESRKAAWDAAADLAFVAPNAMMPRLVSLFCDDLNAKNISNFSALDIAIANHAGESPFVDVLDTKSKHVPNKNVKDYDTLKWEEELRQEVAKKRGLQQKKLTADEQAKVQAQLKKEAGIREDVTREIEVLNRGAGIIKSLAHGPPTDAASWVNQAVDALYHAADAGAGILVGDNVSTAYIACADRTSHRLGDIRPLIAIATLRSLGKTYLPEDLEAEVLGGLVTRILYRLRILSEQLPLDAVSLAYTLPLILLVLKRDGIEEAGDGQGEQVVLALEFISFHSDSFSDPRIPRSETLRLLIQCMRRHSEHHKVIRDTLLDLCRCIAPNITDTEVEILLRGTILPELSVRTAVLQSILSELDLTDLDFSEYIWIACHSHVNEVSEIANDIWEENSLEVNESSSESLIEYLESQDLQLRTSTAQALAHVCEIDPANFSPTFEKLKSMYLEEIRPKQPAKDAYGMPIKAEPPDNWELRSGIALALGALADGFRGADIVAVLQFLIQDGPLVDKNQQVRRQMSESGNAIITLCGKGKVEDLMKLFENTLEVSDKATEQSDWLNEAVVVFYGSLARHLDAGDKRLQKVTGKLLDALSTPSETVQLAVAGCLSPLVRLDDSQISDVVRQLLEGLLQSKSYASRRGSAYGLGGVVRGKGISSLREFRVMSKLREATENKKEPNQRQGAIIAFEVFSSILGRVFEPYIIQMVPQLLTSFSDPSIDVRDACLDAAKACFASLSSFGVKQILPTLLEGLDDSQWRSKKGACDLLGAMAYLDPNQLALNLPDIIPPLTVVLNDSHKEVRNSANRSLQRFGDVISNPEVKSLVGILLKALSDPTKYTDDALNSLISVSFVHYLDAPSLALVARILERGLADRSTTKRKAAQIIGSLAHLTERKDLTCHLPILVAGLKTAIVDPVPTTRATASKALGSLIEKLGEDTLPDLIPSLMGTLKSETGAGDRLGSAQALAEVLAGLGTARLEDTLPSLLQNVSSSKATVREGFMTLFIFLPACFGNSFAAYISRIIPPILAGLADEVEAIRETSLRAGRLLVKNFSSKSLDLLLPELERGLADDNYRIRLSSVELIGDLLFNLTGITGQDDDEEEDTAAQAGQSLLEVLGVERRNKVLSALYICRCDTAGLVRTAAINVWKALVATPRTLKDLVPTLSQVIIRRLASSNMEQKVIAGNALGELIKKAGEGVLSTLLPALEQELLTSTDIDGRQGICIAVRELAVSSSTESLEAYEKELVSIVRSALVDSNQDVRETAAEAFDALQQFLGKKIVDRVLPDLLRLLHNEEDAEQALSALLTLLTESTRANIILPNLIPTLLTRPITAFNARALASLCEVAGSVMNRRLPSILNSLMDEIVTTKDDDLKAELNKSFDDVLDSVDEFDGLNMAMNVMLSLMKHDDHQRRASAANHFGAFFTDNQLDISRFYSSLISALLISFDDPDKAVVEASWGALGKLTGHMRKDEMETLVIPTRQVLRQVGVPGADLPGFCLPKGIGSILPIFSQGLLNGNTDQRVQAALAIGDIVDRTSPDALKPFVTQITGPLIRVVSERSVDIKCAIFLSLNKLLEKIPLFVKPFLPQLQRTFARGLADTSSETLRTRAATGLGILITLTPRVDPLVSELIAGSKTTDDGVKNAMLRALHEVVEKAGSKMSDASKQSVLALVDSSQSSHDGTTSILISKLAGVLLKQLPEAVTVPLIRNRVLAVPVTYDSILRVNSILVDAPGLLCDNYQGETNSVICQSIKSKDVSVAENGVLAAGKYLLSPDINREPEEQENIFEALSQVIPAGNATDVRRVALVVARTVGRQNHDMLKPHLPTIVPPVFSCVRDTIIPIKLAAESAFLSIFSAVDSDSAVFDEYMKGTGGQLPAGPKRSIQDYFKRVALRLAAQARERREAEGGQGGLGLSSDEVEDEQEIWSVGKMGLSESFADD